MKCQNSLLVILSWVMTWSVNPILSQDFNSFFYPVRDAQICGSQWDHKIGLSPENQANDKNNISSDTVLIVPTVVHIMHNDDEANISNEHVKEMIHDLNERFSLRNQDTFFIHPDFRKIMGNARIEFRLASKDPDGHCTTGIVRYDNARDCWDLKHTNFNTWYWYLNIFIVPALEGNRTGVAPSPVGSFKTHLLVNTSVLYYSNPGQYTTVTHEIGHLFGLHHTWGPTNESSPSDGCSMDDDISDTPLQEKANRGSCYDYPHYSCSHQPYGDNFNNYMDYTQSCRSMFTAQQADRMRQTLWKNFYLKDLPSEYNLIRTGTLHPTSDGECDMAPKASFSFEEKDTAWVVPSNPIQFKGFWNHSLPTRWEWWFENGTPSYSTERNPQVSFPETGEYNIKLVVSNSYGSDTLETTRKIFVLPDRTYYSSHLTEDFETSEIGHDIYTYARGKTSKSWRKTTLPDGNQCAVSEVADNTECRQFVSVLTLPPMNIADMKKPRLQFRYALARNNDMNIDGSLNILLSHSPHLPYRDVSQRILRIWGNDMLTTFENFQDGVPQEDQWKIITLDIPDTLLLTENVYITFIYANTNASYIYVDDVQILDPPVSTTSEEKSNDLEVFPNPFHNDIFFKKGDTAQYDFYLINTLGASTKLIPDNHTLHAGHLPSGFYTLSAIEKSTKRIHNFKLIKIE